MAYFEKQAQLLEQALEGVRADNYQDAEISDKTQVVNTLMNQDIN